MAGQCLTSDLGPSSRLRCSVNGVQPCFWHSSHSSKGVSSGTFKVQVLTESLKTKKLSEYGNSDARSCRELQQHTLWEIQ
ncbi:hypothetical protein WJX82_002922 [Trebouxia sp. C0006]